MPLELKQKLPDETHKERARDERDTKNESESISNRIADYKARNCHERKKKRKKDNRIYGLNRKPENESESNLPIEFKIMSRKTKMKKS